MEIQRYPSDNNKPIPPDDELDFGKFTTDHMFLMEYAPHRGWSNPRIEGYRNISLDPAAMVLHYNQEVFEGLKAFCLAGDGIALFRPMQNIERFNYSARRLVMPEIEPDVFLNAVRELVLMDRQWVPSSSGTSLYIRPTMIATEPALGVRPAREYLFYIIAGPVGTYYREGFSPTRIYVTDTYVRAVQGGTGEAKTSSNYGPTLLAFQDAKEKGFDQVLWLDAKEKKYVEEVGTSNIFFVIGESLITPPLSGTILHGVTRDSVLQLAKHWGITADEQPISMDEIIAAHRAGELREVFATGTAAVISPVGELFYQGHAFTIGHGEAGPLSQRLYEEISGIQNGTRKDEFGWLYHVT